MIISPCVKIEKVIIGEAFCEKQTRNLYILLLYKGSVINFSQKVPEISECHELHKVIILKKIIIYFMIDRSWSCDDANSKDLRNRNRYQVTSVVFLQMFLEYFALNRYLLPK